MDIKVIVDRVVEDMIHEPYFVALSPTPPPDWQFPNDHDLWMILRVGRERFVLGLMQEGVRETVGELEARIRSELGDWIAESGFGWGQLRV